MSCLFPQRAFDEVFEIERKLSEKHRLNVAIAEYVSIDVGKVLKMFRMRTFADMKKQRIMDHKLSNKRLAFVGISASWIEIHKLSLIAKFEAYHSTRIRRQR